MFRISAEGSTKKNTEEAIKECIAALVVNLQSAPNYVMVQTSHRHDIATIQAALAKHLPHTKVHGATSCLGAMTHKAHYSEDGYGLTLLGIADTSGSYGTGIADDENPESAGQKAMECALKDANRPGEVPSLIFLTATPGAEEAVIRGIEKISKGTPIVGGSAADNSIEGNWHIFANRTHLKNGVVVSALFPSVKVGTAFHSAYSPSQKIGTITKANKRKIETIDHRPARLVYEEWRGKTFEGAGDLNILAETTLTPLGREVGNIKDAPIYLLSHPAAAPEDGSVHVFTDVQEGETITLMTGSEDTLIARAARVTEAACRQGDIPLTKVQGAFVVYCAGCMLTVQSKMDKVRREINTVLNKPFLSTFTFGEQGQLNGQNCHGNLMISAVVFGSQE